MVKTHVVGFISCSELTLSANHVPCFEIRALHGSGNLCDGLASTWNMVIPVIDYGFNMLWFQSHEMHAWWCSTSWWRGRVWNQWWRVFQGAAGKCIIQLVDGCAAGGAGAPVSASGLHIICSDYRRNTGIHYTFLSPHGKTCCND